MRRSTGDHRAERRRCRRERTHRDRGAVGGLFGDRSVGDSRVPLRQSLRSHGSGPGLRPGHLGAVGVGVLPPHPSCCRSRWVAWPIAAVRSPASGWPCRPPWWCSSWWPSGARPPPAWLRSPCSGVWPTPSTRSPPTCTSPATWPVSRQGIAFALETVLHARLGAGGRSVPAAVGGDVRLGSAFVAGAVLSGAALVALVALPAPVTARIEAPAPSEHDAGSGGTALVSLAVAVAFSSAAAVTLGSFFVNSAVASGTSPGTAGTLLALGSACSIGSRLVAGRWADHRLHAETASPGASVLGLVAIMLLIGAVSYLGLSSGSVGLHVAMVPLAFGRRVGVARRLQPGGGAGQPVHAWSRHGVHPVGHLSRCHPGAAAVSGLSRKGRGSRWRGCGGRAVHCGCRRRPQRSTGDASNIGVTAG